MRRVLIISSVAAGAVIFLLIVLTLFGNHTLPIFLTANFVVLLDKVFGSWIILPPMLSWMLLGTLMGALVYFAIWESHKLVHPKLRPVFLIIPAVLAIASALIWPRIEVRLSGQRLIGSSIQEHTNGLTAGQVETFGGIPFVWIPPGTFRMGSFPDETGRHDDEDPHIVVLTKGFWLGKTEVTQAQWKSVMGNNPSAFADDAAPVENVTWKDCADFIDKLNKIGPYGFRLPTEAEWEFACRAGSLGVYSFGNDARELNAHAWYKDTSGTSTHPVGLKSANAWGLHDMHGNVWEWCQDYYDAYPAKRITDPTGPAYGQRHVLRGGAWSTEASDCRCARRFVFLEGYFLPTNNLGLRLARDLEPEETPSVPETSAQPQQPFRIRQIDLQRAIREYMLKNRQQEPPVPEFDASVPLIPMDEETPNKPTSD